jgi:hypothetical protein
MSWKRIQLFDSVMVLFVDIEAVEAIEMNRQRREFDFYLSHSRQLPDRGSMHEFPKPP